MTGQFSLDDWPLRRVVAATLVVAGVAGVFLLVYLLRVELFILFIAIVLATVLRPIIGWLEHWGMSHALAVVSVYVTLAAVITTAAVFAIPPLLDQLAGLTEELPRIYREWRARLAGFPSDLVARFAEQLPPDLTLVPAEAAPAEQAVTTVAQSLRFLRWIFWPALIGVAVLVLAFYWSLLEERTIRWLMLWVPASRREEATEVIAAAQAKVGAYARGQAILCATMGIATLIAYWLIGMPYAVVLGVAAGILEAVPFFGPILSAIPPLTIALTMDPSMVFWVLLATAGLQQLENYLLVPRIMDRSVGVHAITTLLAIAAFGTLFGLAGLVLAIPLAAILQLLVDRYVLSPEAAVPAEPAGRDVLSRLRYQVQELVQDLRLRMRQRGAQPDGHNGSLEESIEALAQQLDEKLETAREGQDAFRGSIS